MGKGQSPKAKVRSSVRHCSQNKLDRLNQLVDHYIAKRMTLIARGSFSLNDSLDLLKFLVFAKALAILA